MTESERREQHETLKCLRRDAWVLANSFDLPLRGLDAEAPRVKRRYGVCFADGRIRVRLRHARTGRLLKYSSLVDTLCHELAHLRHFDHGPRFQLFYQRVLAYARRSGIYRPGPAVPAVPAAPAGTRPRRHTPGTPAGGNREPSPVQLELF